MATRNVWFEFQCNGGDTELEYTHDIPGELLRQDVRVTQNDPAYMQLFAQTTHPIVLQHEAACRAASSPQCENCERATVKTLMTPMSWLHDILDPFVNVWVTAMCGNATCEAELREAMQNTMEMIQRDAPVADGGPGPAEDVEMDPCVVCGKAGGTKRCSRCKTVAYCGKEHQRMGWTLHKWACAPRWGMGALRVPIWRTAGDCHETSAGLWGWKGRQIRLPWLSRCG